MKYTCSLSIPSLTPELTPVSKELVIAENFLTGYEVYFPSGCAALAGIKIVINGIQIAPALGSSDNWFRGEGTIAWTGRLSLPRNNPSGSSIIIYGYNDDDLYPHTPIIRLDSSNFAEA